MFLLIQSTEARSKSGEGDARDFAGGSIASRVFGFFDFFFFFFFWLASEGKRSHEDESPVEELVVAEDVMTWVVNSMDSTCTPCNGVVSSWEMKSISDDKGSCFDIVCDGQDELGN